MRVVFVVPVRHPPPVASAEHGGRDGEHGVPNAGHIAVSGEHSVPHGGHDVLRAGHGADQA